MKKIAWRALAALLIVLALYHFGMGICAILTGTSSYNCMPVSRDYVLINHFFTNPMYVISYVVSNDAALQIYQLEQTQSGAGAKLLQDNLATQEAYFLAFLESAELKSPFTDSRPAEIRALMEAALG